MTAEGTGLQVGASSVDAQRGDMYVYAASAPHRVTPLRWGRRYTLVIALEDPQPPPTPSGGAGGEARLREHAERRDAYWRHAEGSFDRLASGALAAEPRLHILHGEFLEGADRHAEAQAAYCRAYVATGSEAAAAHAAQFLQDGLAALSLPTGADLRQAEQYFSMAACVVPGHEDANDALAVVRDARARVAEKRAAGATWS